MLKRKPKRVTRSPRVVRKKGEVVAGDTNKYVPANTDSRMLNSAGRHPTYQATNRVDTKYEKNGRLEPTSGVTAIRASVATAVAATATAYGNQRASRIGVFGVATFMTREEPGAGISANYFYRFSRWPPNWYRIAESSLLANSSSLRELNRS